MMTGVFWFTYRNAFTDHEWNKLDCVVSYIDFYRVNQFLFKQYVVRGNESLCNGLTKLSVYVYDPEEGGARVSPTMLYSI